MKNILRRQSVPLDLPPTPDTGLTETEAKRRAELGYDNRCEEDPGKSVWQILAENFFSLFNLLNFALAFCLLLVGSYRNMMFLGVVFSNTFIGTFQELRARKTLRRLKLLNAPTACVLRDGKERSCRSEELVQGDLVIARAGDQVLADGEMISGGGTVNESLLTGESDPISKKPGDELFSGSYLMEGRIVYRLTRVGEASYASRLVKQAKAIKPPKSVLMTDLNKLVRLVSILLCPLGLLLFLKQYFLTHAPLETAIPTTVAAMIGMIPEGLILLTSVALAVGVVRLGKKGTLVQELYGIETLARVDTLCLDKTGTLTKGEMEVQELIPLTGDAESLRADLGRFLSAFDDPTPTMRALRAFVPAVSAEVTATLLCPRYSGTGADSAANRSGGPAGTARYGACGRQGHNRRRKAAGALGAAGAVLSFRRAAGQRDRNAELFPPSGRDAEGHQRRRSPHGGEHCPPGRYARLGKFCRCNDADGRCGLGRGGGALHDLRPRDPRAEAQAGRGSEGRRT